ncbi:MAG: carbohydrate-binding family 9-like protein [Planctomycetaceae bacterium]|jgi:hypothetical protein|nr:carbohydrate-binding family 9-like protein [Planctomycetaceae bacterium]
MNAPIVDTPKKYIFAQHLSSKFDLPELGRRTAGGFQKQYAGTAIEKRIQDGSLVDRSHETYVNAYWTSRFLILRFVSCFDKLSTLEPAITEGKRVGLWERDVVEAFIHPVADWYKHEYVEFQVAPTGEKMDLKLDLPLRDFLWNSKFKTASFVDNDAKIWTADMYIPFAAFKVYGFGTPSKYDEWRINFFRNIASENIFISWIPTMCETAHVPRFYGYIQFMKER